MTTDKKRKTTTKLKPRGEYKVVFKGQLLPGFDKQQVIANIATLTKLPPEKIEKKFFSGKVVIIRRADDETHAQKLQQLFTGTGLEVFILKDLTKRINPQHKSPKSKPKKFNTFIKTNKYPIIAMVLLIVLMMLGLDRWNKNHINIEVPDTIRAIEYSLASKPLLFLARVNLEQLLSQQSHFVSGTGSLPGTDTIFFKQINTAGIDPEKSIKQIISAAYLEKNQLITQTVLLGAFPVEVVKKFFLKHYHAEVIPDASFIRLRISPVAQNACEKGNFMELSIESDRILISSDGHLSELHQLLKQKQGSLTDLSNWQDYSSDKLASLALFVPGNVNLEQGVSSIPGLPMIMAENLVNKNTAADSLFASVGLQLLPSTGVFDVSLNSKNTEWLNKTQTDLMNQIETMKSKNAGLINLQGLLNKIIFQQTVQPDLRKNSAGDIGQLSMAVKTDNEFKSSIETSIHELLASFLSLDLNEDSLSLSIGQHDIKEKLDATPLKYWPQYDQEKFKPFNEALDDFFKPAWIEGPFAISIDELLLESHKDGDQVALQLRGKGQNIDNVGRQQAKIRVTEVNDQQGNNLLDKANCDQPAPSNNAFFSSLGGAKTAYLANKKVTYHELEARQTIKLKKGMKFSRVKSLKGSIELNLATQSQNKLFKKTDQNLFITKNNTRILFNPSSANTLSYTLSGNDEKVLQIRALNEKNEHLSRMSRSSIGNILASGHSVSEKYYGKIAFIEVIYATQFQKINYPFTISKFPPYPSENKWQYELEAVKLSSISHWNKMYQDLEPITFPQSTTQETNWNGKMQASWHNGPFNIALYGLKTSKHQGTTGQLMIKTPLIDELRHNLSALEVFFRYPEANKSGDLGKSYYYPLKAKGYYMNGEFLLDKDSPFMSGQFSFTLPYKNEEQALTDISGDIVIHLPVSKHNSTYTDLSIGALWEDEGVKTKIVRLGNEIIEFAVSGNRNRLLQITLLDSNNKRISTTAIQQALYSQMQSKGGNIIVNYHGVPVKAIFTVSEGQQIKRYPFILKL